ncbi:MAG TPA: LacI family DNA-binding transcriptional regulator [Actinokineospora sp.]|nr:LacI family DNA-binding transcriptional regulator [Actinokineospora sp.]
MTTLADVARQAGVSPATVSRIVSGSTKSVSDELRERVLRAVEELRYVPNAHAQLLARSDRSTVGVVVHDVSDPYFAEITRGLQRIATEQGKLVIICNSYRDPDRELAYVDLLRAQQAEAIILAGSGYLDPAFTKSLGAQLAAYTATGGRVSVIGRHDLAGDAVLPANEEGGYLIASAVFAAGHREVGVIAAPAELTTTADRMSGLRRAAKEYRLAIPDERVRYASFDRDGGAQAAAELLDAVPGLTALIAMNDSMATGALAVLRERGVPVPLAVSVVGFDDMPIAQDLTPTLTTVRLPLVEIGARALALALDDSRGAPRHEVAAAELVLRESLGPPRPQDSPNLSTWTDMS